MGRTAGAVIVFGTAARLLAACGDGGSAPPAPRAEPTDKTAIEKAALTCASPLPTVVSAKPGGGCSVAITEPSGRVWNVDVDARVTNLRCDEIKACTSEISPGASRMRLLPEGRVFDGPVHVVAPFDPAKVPTGMDPTTHVRLASYAEATDLDGDDHPHWGSLIGEVDLRAKTIDTMTQSFGDFRVLATTAAAKQTTCPEALTTKSGHFKICYFSVFYANAHGGKLPSGYTTADEVPADPAYGAPKCADPSYDPKKVPAFIRDLACSLDKAYAYYADPARGENPARSRPYVVSVLDPTSVDEAGALAFINPNSVASAPPGAAVPYDIGVAPSIESACVPGTMAHELFHEVQYRFPVMISTNYTGPSRRWLRESTAEYAATTVFPNHPYFGSSLCGFRVSPTFLASAPIDATAASTGDDLWPYRGVALWKYVHGSANVDIPQLLFGGASPQITSLGAADARQWLFGTIFPQAKIDAAGALLAFDASFAVLQGSASTPNGYLIDDIGRWTLPAADPAQADTSATKTAPAPLFPLISQIGDGPPLTGGERRTHMISLPAASFLAKNQLTVVPGLTDASLRGRFHLLSLANGRYSFVGTEVALDSSSATLTFDGQNDLLNAGVTHVLIDVVTNPAGAEGSTASLAPMYYFTPTPEPDAGSGNPSPPPSPPPGGSPDGGSGSDGGDGDAGTSCSATPVSASECAPGSQVMIMQQATYCGGQPAVPFAPSPVFYPNFCGTGSYPYYSAGACPAGPSPTDAPMGCPGSTVFNEPSGGWCYGCLQAQRCDCAGNCLYCSNPCGTCEY